MQSVEIKAIENGDCDIWFPLWKTGLARPRALSEVSIMLHAPRPAAVPAVSLPLAPAVPPASAVLAAAEHILTHLEQDRPVDAARGHGGGLRRVRRRQILGLEDGL
jgi:hypothetical protein